MRLHWGVKPFNCVFCPYRSAWKGDLKRHMESHHRELFESDADLSRIMSRFKNNAGTTTLNASHPAQSASPGVTGEETEKYSFDSDSDSLDHKLQHRDATVNASNINNRPSMATKESESLNPNTTSLERDCLSNISRDGRLSKTDLFSPLFTSGAQCANDASVDMIVQGNMPSSMDQIYGKAEMINPTYLLPQSATTAIQSLNLPKFSGSEPNLMMPISMEKTVCSSAVDTQGMMPLTIVLNNDEPSPLFAHPSEPSKGHLAYELDCKPIDLSMGMNKTMSNHQEVSSFYNCCNINFSYVVYHVINVVLMTRLKGPGFD